MKMLHQKNVFNGRQYLIKEPFFFSHVSLRCLFHCFKIFAMLLRQLWPWPFFTRFDHFIPHNGKLRAKRKKKPPRLCSWSFNRNFLQVKRYCGTLFGCAAEASQLHLQAVQMLSLTSMTSDIKIKLADFRSNS